MPSLEKIVSTRSGAGRMPLFFISANAFDVTAKISPALAGGGRRAPSPRGFLPEAEGREGESPPARGDAVIGVCGDDGSGAAGPGSRDAQSEIVGLAAGAGEHDVADLGRKGAEQLSREIEHDLLVVAPLCVLSTAACRVIACTDLRVAVPDGCDVVVGVQIAMSGGIVEPDTFAADELHRLVVEQTIRRAEQPASPRNQVLCRNGFIRGGHL